MMYYEQKQDHYDQKTKEKEQAVVSSSSSTTNTTTTTRNTIPGVSQPDEVIERIAEAYAGAISMDIPPMAARMIEMCLRQGMTADCIIAAIHDTGFAARPSPQYLRAILRRCTEQGIKTLEQYRQAQYQHTNMRRAWKNPALNYQQHEYTEADFKDIFYDPTKDFPN